QSLMLRETRRHRIEEGGQDHGQGDNGKKDMGNEDEKIDGPDETLAGKTGIAVNAMVNDVADQEQSRENEGGSLAESVQGLVPRADGEPASKEKSSRRGVESRVDGGKEG